MCWRGLTPMTSRFTLERLECGREFFPCYCYFPQFSLGWEVVQLVGLQTLDLAILVRVQASQPIFSMNYRRLFLKLGNIWKHYLFELRNRTSLRFLYRLCVERQRSMRRRVAENLLSCPHRFPHLAERRCNRPTEYPPTGLLEPTLRQGRMK
jgi:hypothetical protein